MMDVVNKLMIRFRSGPPCLDYVARFRFHSGSTSYLPSTVRYTSVCPAGPGTLCTCGLLGCRFSGWWLFTDFGQSPFPRYLLIEEVF